MLFVTSLFNHIEQASHVGEIPQCHCFNKFLKTFKCFKNFALIIECKVTLTTYIASYFHVIWFATFHFSLSHTCRVIFLNTVMWLL